MTSSLRAFLLAGAAVATVSMATVVHAEDAPAAADATENQVDGVVVTGARTRTSAAAGLDLSLRETPQSVTVIGRQQIETFALNDVNRLLANVVA